MIKRLYEELTGTPWTTTPAWASRDGIPLAGAVYRNELAHYTDVELYARGDQILAELRQQQAHRRVGKTEKASHFVGSSDCGPLLPPTPGGPAARKLAPMAGPPCQARAGLGLPLKAGAGRVSFAEPPTAARPLG
jgi:hypothetical protein